MSEENKNTGITLTDVRKEALESIQQLKNGNMDVKQAKEIREYLKVIIDTGKTQIDFLNALPESIRENMSEDQIKALAGTLRDRDAELDKTLNEVEKNQHKTYKIS